MTARAQRTRSAAGWNASRGQLVTAPAGSGGLVVVPDDGESVAGWLGVRDGVDVFWPAELVTVAQWRTAQALASRLAVGLGGSHLTSRAVFAAQRAEMEAQP